MPQPQEEGAIRMPQPQEEGTSNVDPRIGRESGKAATEPPAPPAKTSHLKTLFPAFVCVFVDFFGYGIAIPILPYFALELGASSAEVGVLIGVFNLAQLFGNMVLIHLG